ncbi:ExeM/NucH family extracellular endonuclease [Shewanella livingstonensis]|uniref:ExeM/NucH family extracellular endonuclease n=1 Tax=Shewanella livingstonensis TaxID=150120 RepID=A0A3G8LVJ9_9GAMM|nr:ExeM/NucH family extracellular endonuclease [Shewanella livingstonensis]AZG73639.1 ExeM/NucH family extracellular endonuclease [Shewanella livingstonensis]
MLSNKTLLAASISILMAFQVSAQDLLISEYVEGSSNNKAIELYNPTDATIALSDYVLSFYFNGNTTATSNITLNGNIAAYSTFVIADNDASAEILSIAQQISTASFFNGDDAIVLSHNANVVDSLGQVGVDPGSEWGSGNLSTQNNTIRRDTHNLTPDQVIDDEITLAGWQGFAQDDISDLGQFSANGSTDPIDPIDPVDSVEFVCGQSAVAIHAIQGNAEASILIGRSVVVEAIVTSNQQVGLKGVFLQMTDAEADGDIATSEGIFVYSGNQPLDVNAGDRIRLQASVAEYQGTTQLANITQFALCGTNQLLPVVASINLPIADNQQLERVEGMRVYFDQALVVNEVYNLGRYGEILLGSSRHFIGTQVANPGADALAVTADNARDSIILDDGNTSQNPEVIVYPAPGLSADNTMRVGDNITALEGVMHYGFNQFRIMPTSLVNVIQSNPRQMAPEIVVDADLHIASFNVLNYFNGVGDGNGFPTARGADTITEFERQRAKIISAMQIINADVFGLMEIENDGYNTNSAISDLVSGLNVAMGATIYAYVVPSVAQIGTDAITVGMIYRTDKLALSGDARILSSVNSPTDDNGTALFDDGKNRPMLTQQFMIKGSEENVVVAVNHLKSKGSNCDSLNDPDLQDGQGNCNQTRTRASDAIGQWLAMQYPDSKVLVMGDLNAYAKEDPLTMLASHGYNELAHYIGAPKPYSYVYSGESGQLDHALANSALLSNVVGITQWHINGDEPSALDYNEEYKSAMQRQELYQADAFRSSDHDPVIISFKFTPSNVLPVASFEQQLSAGVLQVQSTSTDSDGQITQYQWDFGDGAVESGMTASHQYLQSGDYQVQLTITDDKGAVATSIRTVSIVVEAVNLVPIAQIQRVNLWFMQLFISTSYDQDGVIKHHQWLFNNGRKARGPVAFSFSRREHAVALTVVDNDGGKGSVSVHFR